MMIPLMHHSRTIRHRTAVAAGALSLCLAVGSFLPGSVALAHADSTSHVSTSATVPAPRTSVGYLTWNVWVHTSADLRSPTGKQLTKATRVALTRKVSGRATQIWLGGKRLWIDATYVADSKPKGKKTEFVLPRTVGWRFTKANDTALRSAPKDSFVYQRVGKRAELAYTGVTRSGRAQVVYQNAIRWVDVSAVASTNPSLSRNAKKVRSEVRKAFPKVRTIGTIRVDSLPDHPSGRALDVMIADYRSKKGKKSGAEIAAWAQKNATRLNISYVIWNQKIWNASRGDAGWRKMENRGSDTANHKDHVHITVR